MKRKLFVVSMLMVLVGVTWAWGAAVDTEISYKKKTSIAGPVKRLFRFSLWDALTAGNMIWSEEKQVTVNASGVILTLLGDTIPLNPASFSQQLWVQVDRVKAGPIYTPIGVRDKLAVVPFALNSLSSGVGGGLNPLFEPMTNVPEAAFTAQGWTECYSDLYNNFGTLLSTILSACNKSNLMLACRPVGSDTFTVAAFANRNDILTDTGAADNNITHIANGAGWYYNANYSWGFAKAGDSVDKNECDFVPTDNLDKRLCWHTLGGGGSISGGYRCGATADLNDSTTWERIILHHD